MAENSAIIEKYVESMYCDDQQERPLIIMNERFSLLVMGFTGTKSDGVQIGFIEAFNEMDANL